MADLKLVVMDGIWADWLEHFEAVSSQLRAVAARSETELAAEIVDADIVFGRLPREPFLTAENLKWVQSIGVGFETMLYDEMIESNVVITNTAGAFDAAMAEHALALILSWTRGIISSERNRNTRHYTREIPVSQIEGRHVCVLGLGTIGRNVSVRLHHMGMHVAAVDAQVSSPPEGVDELASPDQMHATLEKSDFVVVSLPLTSGTKGLVNASCFDSMPDHAFLVNVSRGPIVNEPDLVEALQSGDIAGAGLDVFEEEPLPESSPLWDMPNAVITPHLGGKSAEGYKNMREIFCENLRRYVKDTPLLNVVDKRKGYVVQSS
jgi:phosphoglycerate dehydrogenase-like enzyme